MAKSADDNKTEKELDAVGKSLKDMGDRIEDFKDLAPALEQRIQEENTVQKLSLPQDRRLRELGEDSMKPLDFGYLMKQPFPKVSGELGEKDIFTPIPSANPGVMASGRELQATVIPEFEWTEAAIDRIEDDLLRFYVDGETT